MTDLPALREAVAQMTGGEWTLDASPGDEACVATVAPGRGQLFLCTMDEDDTTQAERDNNAAGIVALRNAAPALLDEVERLRTIIENAASYPEHPLSAAVVRAELEAAQANYSDIAELLFGEAEYEHDDVRLRVVALLDELEAARAERDTFYMDYRVKTDAQLKQAEADLAALKARTCATCRESVEASSGTRYCIGPGHGVACEEFGFTCGSWAAKEQT